MTSQTTAGRRLDRSHGISTLGGDTQVDAKAIILPPGNFELFDPFLLLSEDWFSTPGFDWHPHRGIETVTIVLDGALEHGDNRGNSGVLHPGDVQWMTAGSGIIHRELAYRNEHAHTLQLWLNLPSAQKLVDARYQDLPADTIPVITEPGVTVHVVSGSVGEVLGPAANQWPITGLLVALEPGSAWIAELPAVDRAFMYVMSGRVLVGNEAEELTAGTVGWSDPAPPNGRSRTSPLTLKAPDGDEVVRLMLFSGRPIREPVYAGGPFVMTCRDEIEQAFSDYRSGAFGPVPDLARR
jgi:redox-sensitive bicupin YhaK (pirin superfamily)